MSRPAAMRILVSACGGYGHLFPVLPLAAAAAQAGHQVTVATHEAFRPVLAAAGLPAISAGPTVRAAVEQARASGAQQEAAPLAFGSIVPRQVVRDLLPVLESDPPDLVIHEVLNPGAAIAASLAGGIPALCHGIGRVSGGASWTAMTQAWAGTAADLGVRVPERNRDFLGSRYLDICPPSLQLPGLADRVDWTGLRPSAWEYPGLEQAGPIMRRDAARPLVYLTLGTAFGAPGPLRQAIDGLARLAVDVIVAAGSLSAVSALGEVPPNVCVAAWVPQGSLLPRADLVVSHGGSGTVLAALASGLPQLLLPQGADQFSNAAAVTAAAAGRALPPAEQDADRIEANARDLLGDPLVRAAAGELGAEIAALPSPAEVAGRLPELAG